MIVITSETTETTERVVIVMITEALLKHYWGYKESTETVMEL
jgi:hypothetical protein